MNRLGGQLGKISTQHKQKKNRSYHMAIKTAKVFDVFLKGGCFEIFSFKNGHIKKEFVEKYLLIKQQEKEE